MSVSSADRLKEWREKESLWVERKLSHEISITLTESIRKSIFFQCF